MARAAASQLAGDGIRGGPLWTLPQLAAAVACMVGVYLGVFAVGVLACLPAGARRARSWLLTTTASAGTTLPGLYFGYRVFRTGLGPLGREDPYAMDYGLSVLTVLFFFVFLVLDLVVGSLFYREHLTLVNGWIHHTVYMCILTWILYNNHSASFAAFMFAEMPTFLMSLGQLSSRLRSDLLFGLSYLVTRVLYHGALMTAFLLRWNTGWTLTVAIFGIHVHWFRAWVLSQKRKGFKLFARSASPPAK